MDRPVGDGRDRPLPAVRRSEATERNEAGGLFHRAGLAAVKDLVAQIPHRQYRVIGPSRWLHGDASVFHLADKNRVIAHFNRIDEGTLNKCRGLFQNRRAQSALAKCFPADAVSLALQRFEERESLPLLLLAKHV